MLRRIRDLIRKSPTAKHVSTLLSGTVIAQLLALVTAPLISRLYSPTEIGVYTLFTSVVATVVAVAGLRYDLGIVLPKSHGNARLLRNNFRGKHMRYPFYDPICGCSSEVVR